MNDKSAKDNGLPQAQTNPPPTDVNPEPKLDNQKVGPNQPERKQSDIVVPDAKVVPVQQGPFSNNSSQYKHGLDETGPGRTTPSPHTSLVIPNSDLIVNPSPHSQASRCPCPTKTPYQVTRYIQTETSHPVCQYPLQGNSTLFTRHPFSSEDMSQSFVNACCYMAAIICLTYCIILLIFLPVSMFVEIINMRQDHPFKTTIETRKV